MVRGPALSRSPGGYILRAFCCCAAGTMQSFAVYFCASFSETNRRYSRWNNSGKIQPNPLLYILCVTLTTNFWGRGNWQTGLVSSRRHHASSEETLAGGCGLRRGYKMTREGCQRRKETRSKLNIVEMAASLYYVEQKGNNKRDFKSRVLHGHDKRQCSQVTRECGRVVNHAGLTLLRYEYLPPLRIVVLPSSKMPLSLTII